MHMVSKELGDIRIGFVETPVDNSYYCSKHKEKGLTFKVRDQMIEIHPDNIKKTRLRNYHF